MEVHITCQLCCQPRPTSPTSLVLFPSAFSHSRREQLTAAAFKLEPRVTGQTQIAGHTAGVQVCSDAAFLTDCISEKVTQMLLVWDHNLRTIVLPYVTEEQDS